MAWHAKHERDQERENGIYKRIFPFEIILCLLLQPFNKCCVPLFIRRFSRCGRNVKQKVHTAKVRAWFDENMG